MEEARKKGYISMKAVFIDIDNTLLSFDEYVKRTMKVGFAHFDLKPYEPSMYEVFTRENNKLWQGIEQGTLTFEKLQKIRWNKVFQSLGIEFDGEEFERYFREQLFESAIPEPGAYEMLHALKKKDFILCVASNGPYAQQVHRLEIAEMKQFFDYIFISEQVQAAKPSRDFFAHAFGWLNEGREIAILPQETVIIGDSLSSDIAGGRQYGMKTCYYRRDKNTPIPDTVDIVVDDLSQVAEYIQK